LARAIAGLIVVAVWAPLAYAAPDLTPADAQACTPVLEIKPADLNFGSVVVGQVGVLDISIGDAETEPGCQIEIQGISLDFGAPNFELLGLPSLPVLVTVGSPITFQVRFSPPSPGNFAGQITITSNDAQNPSRTVQLNGTGTGENLPPTCDADGPYNGTVGVPVAFDGSGSTDPDGTVDSYAWDFGDGSTDTGATPTHTYASQGKFPVTLTVTDNLGATSTCKSTATITGDGKDTITVTAPNGGESFAPGTTTPITWNSTGTGVPSVDIELSTDGGTTFNALAVSEANDGSFDWLVINSPTTQALIRVKDSADSTPSDDSDAVFTIEGVRVTRPNGGESFFIGTVEPITWDRFGTGIANVRIELSTDGFSFTDIVASTENDGTFDWTVAGTQTAEALVRISDVANELARDLSDGPFNLLPEGANIPPTCDAGGPYSGTVNIPVLFDGSGSSDPDGTVDSYAWDFGDGSTDTGATPSHTYTSQGKFPVTLTVTDNLGATSTCKGTATITGPNDPPVCNADGPYNGTVGVLIQFDGSGSSDPDGTIDSYAWDFGDGGTGTGATPFHAYLQQGKFPVTLTVTDNLGATSTCKSTATITGGENLPPICNANGPYTGAPGVPIQFDGSGSSDPDGTVDSYSWDFGDGTIETGATPSHAYVSAGTFTVTLTVADNLGATSTCETTATVTGGENLPPVCDADGPYSGVRGEPIEFDGTDSEDPDGTIASYTWDFGDGTIETGATPTHTYISVGTFTVTLTVADDLGATSTCKSSAEVVEPGTFIRVALPPRSFGAPGSDVTIPLFLLDDVTGQGILSAEFSIEYDRRVLRAQDVTFTGTVGSGATFEWHVERPSSDLEIIRVSAAWVQPIAGCEEMALVLFQATERDDFHTELDLEITFNEGTPEAQAQDGEFFKGLLADVNCSGNRSPLDASLILQETVEIFDLPEPEFPCFTVETADVSGNDEISAFDASLILRYLLGEFDKFPIEENLKCGAPRGVLAGSGGERTLAFEAGPMAADGTYEVEIGIDDLAGVFGADLVLEVGANARVVAVKSLVPETRGLVASRVTDGTIQLAVALSAKGDGRTSLVAIQLAPIGGPPARVLNVKSAVLNEGAIAVKGGGSTAPIASTVTLAQNHPNPFNPATQITWTQPEAGRVELAIVDASGRRVRILVRGSYPAGLHAAEWNGRDEAGRTMAAGVYFYMLDAGGAHLTRKMLLLK
jgi:PKD repeat protein